MRWFIASLIVASLMLTLVASVQAAPVPGNLILQVPDWNQPNSTEYPGNGLPANPNAYPGWCSATAGANLMGYWDDVKGCDRLTDNQAFNATPPYLGTPNTWKQGLYHDGMIEMGWYMDTSSWRTNQPVVSPPFGMGGTNLGDIGTGLQNYAKTGWMNGAITKVAYPNTTWSMETSLGVNPTPLATMWATYRAEIDAARPVEATFDRWITTVPLLGTVTIEGFLSQTIEEYGWTSTEPHSVVGVGYIDLNPGFQGGGDEMFVCQDGWSSTGRYVAVPVDAHWWQNDYITYVPEPSTLVLLVIGAAGLFAYGWRRRRS